MGFSPYPSVANAGITNYLPIHHQSINQSSNQVRAWQSQISTMRSDENQSSCAEDHVVTRWELHSPFMPSLYFSFLQLFNALRFDKMRSEMRALRHLECERGPWDRTSTWLIARTNKWWMWLSNLHRHPNHMWSYWDRTSRWLIAPADDACDWVAFIFIRTTCYLI